MERSCHLSLCHFSFIFVGGRPSKDLKQSDYINSATEGGDSGGDIDYARIAQLMRQVYLPYVLYLIVYLRP